MFTKDSLIKFPLFCVYPWYWFLRRQCVLIHRLMATRLATGLLVMIASKFLVQIFLNSQIQSQEESGLLFWLFVVNYCDHA